MSEPPANYFAAHAKFQRQQQAARRRQYAARSLTASESQEQRALIEIVRAHANHERYGVINDYLIAIPNGAYTQRYQNPETGEWYSPNAQKLLAEGLAPGFPDLFLYLPAGEFHGLAIEMKSATGRLAKRQHIWQLRLTEAGYGYQLCRSADEAWDALVRYINGRFANE